MIKLPSMR